MVSRDSSLGVRVGMALSLVLDVSMHTLVSGVVPRYPDAYGTGTCGCLERENDHQYRTTGRDGPISNIA